MSIKGEKRSIFLRRYFKKYIFIYNKTSFFNLTRTNVLFVMDLLATMDVRTFQDIIW